LPGDGCANPFHIDLANLPFSEQRTDHCEFNDLTRSANYSACGGSGYYDDGKDIFYALDPAMDSELRIALTDNTGGGRGALWVFENCPGSGSETCLGFISDYTVDADMIVSVEAGHHYVVMIDAYNPPGCMDDFTLTISEFGGAGPGDNCATAFDIDLSSLPFIDHRTDMCGFNNLCHRAKTTGCGGNGEYDNGRDVFYSFTAVATMGVRIQCADNIGGDAGALWVFEGCPCLGSEACLGYAGALTLNADVRIGAVAGHTYTIMIDGRSEPGCMSEYTLMLTETELTATPTPTTVPPTPTPSPTPGPPNLIVSWVVPPENLVIGYPLNLQYQVTNRGEATAHQPWTDRVSISSDDQIGGDIELAALVRSSNLSRNWSYANTCGAIVPALDEGGYWLVIETDSGDTVAETNEADNAYIVGPITAINIDYQAVVQTEFTSGFAGDAVPLHGLATMIDTGDPAAGKLIAIKIRLRDSVRTYITYSNAAGEFSTTFHPLPTEAGVYSMMAGHPAAVPTVAQDTFQLLGMRPASTSASYTVFPGIQKTGTATLRNLGEIPLSGISASVEDAPPNLNVGVSVSSTLPGLASRTINLTMNAADDSVSSAAVTVRFTSAEGAETTLTLNITIRNAYPVLSASPSSLSATMIRTEQTLVTFNLINSGAGTAVNVNVQIPQAEWLALASPALIETIGPGASVPVVLSLIPDEDLPLGQYTGTLYISSDNAAPVSPHYSFNCISQLVGDLNIMVTDELTFYAPGSPGVEGAAVTVRNNLNQIVAQGQTDSSGTIAFYDLPEGSYRVSATAPNHAANQRVFEVAPGVVTEGSLFLTREFVTYVWRVVPTEIEDHYTFVIETVFETYVPVPVVTIEPAVVDFNDMIDGEMQVDFTITNHGLIAAEETSLFTDGNDRYEISAVVRDIGRLPANTSYVVPVVYRDLWWDKAQGRVIERKGWNCTAYLATGTLYMYECGPDHVWHTKEVRFVYPALSCGYSGPVGGGYDPGGSGDGGPSSNYSSPRVEVDNSCDPCEIARGNAVFDCLISFIPLDCPATIVLTGVDCVSSGLLSWDCARSVAGAAIGCADLAPVVGQLWNIFWCGYDIITACNNLTKSGGPGRSGMKGPVEAALADVETYTYRIQALADAMTQLFGSPVWLSGAADDAETLQELKRYLFITAADDGSEDGPRISAAELAVFQAMDIPAHMTGTDLTLLAERWNRTLDYQQLEIFTTADVPAGWSDDFIAHDLWSAAFTAAEVAEALSQADGYQTVLDGAYQTMEALQDAMVENPAGVCARVTVHVQQDAVLTRSAFEAQLDLTNNGTYEVLEDVAVEIFIRDEQGNDAASLFAIGAPELTGISALDGTDSLGPGGTALARWLLVPTREAAPSEPARYFVSGLMTYVLGDYEVVTPLFPDEITVYPDPVLHVEYFHERTVYSDDPFTPETEPAVPYSLGMIVWNSGAGEARNLQITSGQPAIIENDKGLLIHFSLIGAQLGLDAISPSLTIDFGTIQPEQRKVARWLMTSTLEGQFIEYSATFTHNDAIGDAHISLFDSVGIHPMEHVVRVDAPVDDQLPDFLVDDAADPEDYPDVIYSSDGELLLVTATADGAIDAPPGPGHLTLQLTAVMPAGWSYLRIPDPAGDGRAYRLISAVRSDSKAIRLQDNIWTTHRIERVEGEPPEPLDRLHLLDKDSTGSYVLTYEVIDPTPTPTMTPTHTGTPLPTNTPTNSPLPTMTPTVTQTPTITNTPLATNSPTNSPLPTSTRTPTLIPTVTNTPLPTNTPTDTPLPTLTPTAAEMPTVTPTATLTPTVTLTPTETPLPTGTPSPEPSATPEPTLAPTATPVCEHSGDANLDGMVTPGDAQLTFYIYLNCAEIAPSWEAYCAADFCGAGHLVGVCNGAVTPADAQGIFRYYLGYANPCGT